LALVFGYVHALVHSPRTYAAGYERYDIAARTGLSDAELRDATRSFVRYFEGNGELDTTIERGGARRPLFNDRELRHMRDVRELFWLGDRVFAGAALYLAAFTVIGLVTRRLRLRELAFLGIAGSTLTLALGLVFSLSSLIDFEALFVRF